MLFSCHLKVNVQDSSSLLSCETSLHGSHEGPLDLNWGIYGPGGTLPSNKRLGLHHLKYLWIASFDG